MSTQPNLANSSKIASLSAKAASGILAAETRAFGNAAAKLNLQLATAKFEEAKQSQLSSTVQAADAGKRMK